MRLQFNEKNVKKIENSPKNTRSLRFITDTRFAFACIGSAFLFLILGFLLSVVLPKTSAIRTCYAGFILLIIFSISFFSGISYKKLKKYCDSEGIDINDVEQDFNNTVIHGLGVSAVGNKYIIFSEKVIPFEKICWVFFFQPDPANKKGCITVCTNDGAAVNCAVPIDHAAAFLNEVNEKHPEVILGYSLELEKLFSSDFSEFKEKAASMKPESIYEIKSSNL